MTGKAMVSNQSGGRYRRVARRVLLVVIVIVSVGAAPVTFATAAAAHGATDATAANDDPPPKFRLQGGIQTPNTVTQGEVITVSVVVENPFGPRATQPVTYELNRIPYAKKNVTLERGESKRVRFRIDTGLIGTGEFRQQIEVPNVERVSGISARSASVTVTADATPTAPTTVTVTGEGEYASYEITTNREVVAGARLEQRDGISADGQTASGGVTSFTDEYVINGSITGIQIDGTATVRIDGELVNPIFFGDEDTLRIAGTGNRSLYQFDTTGGEPATSSGLEPPDSVEGAGSAGSVYGGSDVYTFTGKLQKLAVSGGPGGAKVYLDGERIDPNDYPTDFNSERSIRIVGNGTAAAYEFVVETDVNYQFFGPVSLAEQGSDRISGTRVVTGVVGSGADEFGFDGELQAFDAPAGVTVYVDGERIDPEEYPDVHRIDFDGTTTQGEYADRGRYSITVPGEFVVGEEDNLAPGTDSIDREVYLGTDRFYYIGPREPTTLEIEGNVTVRIDGDVVATSP